MRAPIALLAVLFYLVACGSTPAADDDNDAGLAPGSCRASADCNEGESEYCARPGEGPGCGACYSGDCFIDGDCVDSHGAGYICGPLSGQCACGNGGECVLGCAAAGCGPQADCGADDRCVTRTCAIDDDCGDPQLRCVAGLCKVPGCFADDDCEAPNVLCNLDSYACYRLSCNSDSECSGYCVLGQCYDEAGHCQQPAA